MKNDFIFNNKLVTKKTKEMKTKKYIYICLNLKYFVFLKYNL